MKKIINTLLMSGALFFMVGCASYQTVSLAALDPDRVEEIPQEVGLYVGSKIYSEKDCFEYFDRNLLAKGYQPVQLTLQNVGERTYTFSLADVSLPCADPERVAERVKTSTLGRFFGYSMGGLVIGLSLADPSFISYSLIPAVVDGIKSVRANAKLTQDFAKKGKIAFTLPPKAFVKTVLFIPIADFSSPFTVTLFDQTSEAPVLVTIKGE